MPDRYESKRDALIKAGVAYSDAQKAKLPPEDHHPKKGKK